MSLQTARQEMALGDQRRAIELLKTACTQEPHWLRPREYLAMAYQALGDEGQARAEYLALQRLTLDWALAGRANRPDVREEVAQAEAEATLLINRVRRERKLGLLRLDPLLAVCAREHSLEMRDGSFCEHFSPTPGCRAAFDRFRLLYGFLPANIAENIARIETGAGERGLVDRIVETRGKLMSSPGHRKNALLPNATSVGVGVAVNAEGILWITEVFAQATAETGGAAAAGGSAESISAGASDE